MKKLLAISFACLYLLVSSGLLLEIHHCMGRIADAGITLLPHNDEDQCGRCGMDKGSESNHCCKDEYKQVKVSADQKVASLYYILDAPEPELLSNSWPAEYQLVPIREHYMDSKPHGPPPRLQPPVQSLLCVFRI